MLEDKLYISDTYVCIIEVVLYVQWIGRVHKGTRP